MTLNKPHATPTFVRTLSITRRDRPAARSPSENSLPSALSAIHENVRRAYFLRLKEKLGRVKSRPVGAGSAQQAS